MLSIDGSVQVNPSVQTSGYKTFENVFSGQEIAIFLWQEVACYNNFAKDKKMVLYHFTEYSSHSLMINTWCHMDVNYCSTVELQ